MSEKPLPTRPTGIVPAIGPVGAAFDRQADGRSDTEAALPLQMARDAILADFTAQSAQFDTDLLNSFFALE